MTATNQNPKTSQPIIVQTAGAVLANGALLEPVLGAGSEALNRALWHHSQPTIAPRAALGGKIYEPTPIELSISRELYLPAKVAPAESGRQLSTDLSRTIVCYTGLPDRCALLCAHGAFASWFVMNFSAALWLSVIGVDDLIGKHLLRLMRCFCRVALPLVSLSVASVCVLPLGWHFTILVREPQLTLQTRHLLHAATSVLLHK